MIGPGGTVAAYAWDILGGGSPTSAISFEMQTMGIQPSFPPSVAAARLEALLALWTNVGLKAVETHEITVSRTFASFDEFWMITRTTPGINTTIAGISPADVGRLKARVQERLPADSDGRITYAARAHAVKGYLLT